MAELMNNHTPTLRETVGVFRDFNVLQDTVDELEQNGFRHEEISVLSNSEKTYREHLSAPGMHVKHIMDNPGAPRSVLIPREVMGEARSVIIGIPLYFGAGMGAVLAAINSAPLSVIIVWAIIAGLAGAALGGIFAWLASRWWKDGIRRQIDRGGLLLWVHVDTPEKEIKAREILTRHHARYLHTHQIPAE